MEFRKLKLPIFLIEVSIFGITQVLGLVVALALLQKAVYLEVQVPVSVLEFIISFAIATLLILLFIKVFKGGRFFKILFAVVIFLGCQILFSTVMSGFAALLLALGMVILRFALPRVWIHNLAIVLSVAGISASFGLSLPVAGILIILLILSVYDIIAVYKTRHMVTMFRELLMKGVIFSIVVPEKIKNWNSSLEAAKPGEGFLFLGTGDIALPLIFAVSALPYGIGVSLGIIIGAVFGILAIHLMFVMQKKPQPMPALPPIAFFSILGFLISLII